MPRGTVSKEARTSPPVRVSYPQVFTPKTFRAGQTARFSIVIMVAKSDSDQVNWMKQLYKDAQEALLEKWPNEVERPRIPLTGHDSSLFKDGDSAINKQGIPLVEKNPEYAGHYILRASTTQKPFVVDRRRTPITDQNEVYGGCFCLVNVNIYTFEQPENKGVTLGLNGLQKWEDGDAFGGGRPAIDEMFDVYDDGSNDPANYSDAFGPAPGGDDPLGLGNPQISEDDIPF